MHFSGNDFGIAYVIALWHTYHTHTVWSSNHFSVLVPFKKKRKNEMFLHSSTPDTLKNALNFFSYPMFLDSGFSCDYSHSKWNNLDIISEKGPLDLNVIRGFRYIFLWFLRIYTAIVWKLCIRVDLFNCSNSTGQYAFAIVSSTTLLKWSMELWQGKSKRRKVDLIV